MGLALGGGANGAVRSLAFSPDYAVDHTLYGWAGSSGLMRSTDGGETWTPVSAGLVLDGFGSGQVMIPPDYASSRTVYFVWTPSSPDIAPQFFRSTDAAATWQSPAGDPPQRPLDRPPQPWQLGGGRGRLDGSELAQPVLRDRHILKCPESRGDAVDDGMIPHSLFDPLA